MTCKRSTLKKYKSRPSPPFPAQECKGKKKKVMMEKYMFLHPHLVGFIVGFFLLKL